MLRSALKEEEGQLQPNTFRIAAFANAIEAVSQIDEVIKSGDDYCLEVKGIGIGIRNRINQYFVTQDLIAAQNHEEKQDALRRRAVIDLQKVPGIGRVKAKALVEAGCWSLASILGSDKFHHMLTAQQIICLKYIDHLDQPLSQGEAERILESFVERLPSQYEAVLVGESRRGVSKIPTVSIMLTHPDHVHVPMPTDPPPPSFSSSPSPSEASTSQHTLDSPSAPPPSSSSPSDATPASTPLKKRKNVLKKSERTSSLTKAARSSSVLHSDAIPCLRNGDVLFETINETLNTWTGVVKVPPLTPPPVPPPLFDFEVEAETPKGKNKAKEKEKREAGQEDEVEEDLGEPTGSSIALSLQTPFGCQFRRIVVQLVPQKSQAAALVALTGDDELNRHMRKKAEQMGMLLNEYGLWRWNTNHRPPAETTTGSETGGSEHKVEAPAGFWGLVETPTEESVFRELKMGFISPHKRSWGFLSGALKSKPTRKKFSTSFVGS